MDNKAAPDMTYSMFKEWLYFKREYEKYHDTMMLDGYSWNEKGLLIKLRSLSDKKYQLIFLRQNWEGKYIW